MQRRRIGSTDLEVFPLCLGGNVFGWTCDEAESFAVLDAYAAAGGNIIDTADTYSDGAGSGLVWSYRNSNPSVTSLTNITYTGSYPVGGYGELAYR